MGRYTASIGSVPVKKDGADAMTRRMILRQVGWGRVRVEQVLSCEVLTSFHG